MEVKCCHMPVTHTHSWGEQSTGYKSLGLENSAEEPWNFDTFKTKKKERVRKIRMENCLIGKY